MLANQLAEDLEHVLEHTEDLWVAMRGERIFLTGGTGFFGCWLLESFAWANARLKLGAQATVLTRSPAVFTHKAPHLAANPAIQLFCGEVGTFEFPQGAYAAVVHAAVQHFPDPWDTLDAIIGGTRRTLDLACQSKARRYLFASSGAVYGRQPPELEHLPESYPGAPGPENLKTAYGQGKRIGEFLCSYYYQQYGIEPVVARGFAFIGPYLPLDANYAVGNFIRDALNGAPIHIQGDGTPYRSYLYAADLAIWLWTLLLRGRPGEAYNVGSEAALTIAELARQVTCVVDPQLPVQIAQTSLAGVPAERYVPATQKAASELGLQTWIPLDEALRRTVRWHELRDLAPN